MAGARPGLRMQPPAAGADTRAVLAAAGVDPLEIERLAAAGILDLGAVGGSRSAAE